LTITKSCVLDASERKVWGIEPQPSPMLREPIPPRSHIAGYVFSLKTETAHIHSSSRKVSGRYGELNPGARLPYASERKVFGGMGN
uniref:Uncharacterized protein n=1 Tax=Heterorhabditis bacteriophora TaxID=37862 RepID=A0A1I7WDL5_HETBA